ncbi:MAG TPA: DUF4159 domain-containing protein [Vicinamibacterales bacterium]|nr:DUF4159 domain-containing protein [Vicinamibacterales bacterium]
MNGRTRLTWSLLCAIAALAVAAGAAHAQIWRGGFGFNAAPRHPTATTFAGGFNHCRLMFTSDHREKRGWSTDYPGADINFSVRLGELTRARITKDKTGDPDYLTVSATEPALFQCPYILVEDGGSARFSDPEVIRLREYLEKGGFLFVSDYWGTRAGEQWDEEIGRVLPRDKFPIIDLPPGHPLWSSIFVVKEVPQMPSIQFWRRSGGGMSERGEDSAVVNVSGIADAHGRLMVVMIHNSDIPDGWEREAEDPQYFYKFSPDAYSVGIDIVLYAMTH